MPEIGSATKGSSAFRDQILKRGDLLILPETQALGVAGSVAWVRHIWQTNISKIAIRTSEIGLKDGERIARLDSPYRYRLTQVMAQVFSDIGLPDVPNSIERNLKEVYDNG